MARWCQKNLEKKAMAHVKAHSYEAFVFWWRSLLAEASRITAGFLFGARVALVTSCLISFTCWDISFGLVCSSLTGVNSPHQHWLIIDPWIVSKKLNMGDTGWFLPGHSESPNSSLPGLIVSHLSPLQSFFTISACSSLGSGVESLVRQV